VVAAFYLGGRVPVGKAAFHFQLSTKIYTFVKPNLMNGKI
jgi:hypothetical protein